MRLYRYFENILFNTDRSYIRLSNPGYDEQKDEENVIKFRYAIDKYTQIFLQENKTNKKIDSSDLNFMDQKLPIYMGLPVLFTFSSYKIINKFSFLTIIIGGVTSVMAVNRYYNNYNHSYQMFLVKNFHLFDQNFQKLLKSGDHRYMLSIIPDKSLKEISKSTDQLLMLW